jgi:trimethylamine--corrinoid protein Co-methyltransferase
MKPFEVLTKSDCKAVHEASLKVLWETGMVVLDKRGRDIFQKNGCEVDEQSMRVRFPESLVNDCLKKAPSSFVIRGRDKKKACKVSYEGPMRYSNFGTAVKWGTFDEKGAYHVRDSTIQDVAMGAKFVDATSNLDMGVTPCSATDLVGGAVQKDVHEQYEALLNNTKHQMADWTAQNIHYGFEFQKAYFGGDEEEALANPFYTIGAAPASPLIQDPALTTCVIEATKYQMPVMAMSMVLCGATGPINIAGSLVVNNAETLATNILTQCLKPGNPTWYGSSSTGFDLKSGLAPVGSPERAMFDAAWANMGAFYKLPSFVAAVEGDSKIIDAQLGHEKTMTGLLPALAKASMCFGPGMLELGLTFSPEQLLIDSDIINMVRWAENGVIVNEETLGLSDISEVGPGGNFFAQPSTLNNIDHPSSPALFNRSLLQDWVSAGSKNIAMAAHDAALDIMKNYQPEPIERDILSDIQAIVVKADKEKKG